MKLTSLTNDCAATFDSSATFPSIDDGEPIWAEQGAQNTCSPMFVSSYLPASCGLATFTRDLADAVDQAAGEPVSAVAAIQRDQKPSCCGERVCYLIDNGQGEAYRRAARANSWLKVERYSETHGHSPYTRRSELY